MPYNGSGVFQLISGNPVVTGTTISSSWANGTLADLSTNGLSNCITKDGQTTPTANIGLGGFRLTALANAITRTDGVPAGQIQDGGLLALSTIAGTDTITAAISPAIPAYAAGQAFRFIAAGTNATTSVTLNISGLGAKPITKQGNTPLAIGDIVASSVIEVFYDGTQFQLMNLVGGGRLTRYLVYLGNATYTPDPRMSFIIAKAQGAGGGAAGAGGAGAGQVSLGSPGGAGALGVGRYTAAQVGASAAITVGNGGTSVANANGNNGGTTSIGSLLSCPGGAGGIKLAPTLPPAAQGNPSGATASGANLYQLSGVSQFFTIAHSTTFGFGGAGAASIYGMGGSETGLNTAGISGFNYGSGGGGIVLNQGGGASTGGNGAPGIVEIWEYV